MNSLNLIMPYRYEGMRVFDDSRTDLNKEPLVSGADILIDLLVVDVNQSRPSFTPVGDQALLALG